MEVHNLKILLFFSLVPFSFAKSDFDLVDRWFRHSDHSLKFPHLKFYFDHRFKLYFLDFRDLFSLFHHAKEYQHSFRIFIHWFNFKE